MTETSKSKAKFTNRNLNALYKAPRSKKNDTNGGSHNSFNRMLILSKSNRNGIGLAAKARAVAAPAPINTPSLRRENQVKDGNTSTTSTGPVGWGIKAQDEDGRDSNCNELVSKTGPRDHSSLSTEDNESPWERAALKENYSITAAKRDESSSRSTQSIESRSSISPLIHTAVSGSTGRWGDDMVEQEMAEIQDEKKTDAESPQHQQLDAAGLTNSIKLDENASNYLSQEALPVHRERDSWRNRYSDLFAERQGPHSYQNSDRYSFDRLREAPNSRYNRAESPYNEVKRRFSHSQSNSGDSRFSNAKLASNFYPYEQKQEESSHKIHDGHSQSTPGHPMAANMSHRASLGSFDAREMHKQSFYTRGLHSGFASQRDDSKMSFIPSKNNSSWRQSHVTLPEGHRWPTADKFKDTTPQIHHSNTFEPQISNINNNVQVSAAPNTETASGFRILKRSAPKMLFDPKSSKLVEVTVSDTQRRPRKTVQEAVEKPQIKSKIEAQISEPKETKVEKKSVPVQLKSELKDIGRSVEDQQPVKRRSALIKPKIKKLIIAYRPVKAASENSTQPTEATSATPASLPVSKKFETNIERRKKAVVENVFVKKSSHTNSQVLRSERAKIAPEKRTRKAHISKDGQQLSRLDNQIVEGHPHSRRTHARSNRAKKADSNKVEKEDEIVVKDRTQCKFDVELLRRLPEGEGVVVLTKAQNGIEFSPEDEGHKFETVKSRRTIHLERKMKREADYRHVIGRFSARKFGVRSAVFTKAKSSTEKQLQRVKRGTKARSLNGDVALKDIVKGTNDETTHADKRDTDSSKESDEGRQKTQEKTRDSASVRSKWKTGSATSVKRKIASKAQSKMKTRSDEAKTEAVAKDSGNDSIDFERSDSKTKFKSGRRSKTQKPQSKNGSMLITNGSGRSYSQNKTADKHSKSKTVADQNELCKDEAEPSASNTVARRKMKKDDRKLAIMKDTEDAVDRKQEKNPINPSVATLNSSSTKPPRSKPMNGVKKAPPTHTKQPKRVYIVKSSSWAE